MSRPSLPIGALLGWSALAVCAVVVGWSLPIDDFYLSIASGRAIADGASISQPLPFSWTDEVPGALNPQWGSQVVLGWHGSLAIALAVNAVLLATSLGVTTLRAAARASAPAIAAALLLTLSALAPHLLARAQSFSLALFPVALLLLERFGRRAWLPLAYGALIVLWANLHGAFVVGQLAAVLWLVATLLAREGRGIAAATAVVALVAPLLNPVGAELLGYAYGQPALDVVTAISVEWQPSWPWIAITIPFWLILVALVTGRVLRRPGARVFDLLVVATLAALAISAVRHIPWFLLAAAPMLASDVDALLRRWPRLQRAIGTLPPAVGGRHPGHHAGIPGRGNPPVPAGPTGPPSWPGTADSGRAHAPSEPPRRTSGSAEPRAQRAGLGRVPRVSATRGAQRHGRAARDPVA